MSRRSPVLGRHGGFALVEVIVALVVLEVGVLAVLGVLSLASRTMARAELLEHVAATAEGVADSLARAPSLAAGRSDVQGGGSVAWMPMGAGFRIVAWVGSDTLVQAVGLRSRGRGPW